MKKRFVVLLALCLIAGAAWAAARPTVELNVRRGDTVRIRMQSERNGTKVAVFVNGKTQTITINDDDSREWKWVLSSDKLSFTGAVSEFDCSGNRDAITGISVNNNNELEELDCSNCALETLSLHGNANLEEVDCHANHLKELDLTGNPKMEKLFCSYNRLAKLTLTGLKSLEELDCKRNHLTSLNLDGLEELEKLDCSDNRLEELVVPESRELEWIACDGNDLGPRTFIHMIRRLPIRRASDPGYLRLDGVFPKLASERNWRAM